ncbi:type III secretion system ATPase, FliI/YscN [Thermosyntropha lipolytica DSM 11003]|uniref:Type III secretion system ATPase, FliI/YscN n=1 Tax=Thermosyntropha lipolytica DSM 11003 TaxID=1123382 RepID=A0A1M5KZW0_9FIRM|nr:flagellar protein export ATPase FliI [Thermosyntropha lipolytica]SHG58338.1 type III secretion system ATPase, FliI/YscN [Thermosyntropha lipolytica DSM 11003]
MHDFQVDSYLNIIENTQTYKLKGRVSQAIGLTLEAYGPKVKLGELCYISTRGYHDQMLPAEVVGFKGNKIILMPLGSMEGVSSGSELIATGRTLEVGVGFDLIGRVLNGLGEPIDGKENIKPEAFYPVVNKAPDPLKRRRITEILPVGVKAIDGLITIGKGQRIGIMAGSGVGKSTLLGMIARNTTADINVIALIGERGREVRDFLERDLGEKGLARSVVVVATSDQPALVRLKGAFVATSIAEYFRDQGKDVLLLMDSLTRFAMAQREVGLAIGEPPATRGYTPSVFAQLPMLLERAGNSERGTITGMYTVLVEGDDMNEPITDAVRGIVDGHIVLSRRLAAMNIYPAIDVLNSISRVMIDVVSREHLEMANRYRSILAVYEEARDLIEIGAYRKGANPKIDEAIALIDKCLSFSRQDIYEEVTFEQVLDELRKTVEG